MNLDSIFNEVLITEMARADLKGAGEALNKKDWAKAAKIYVKNTRERGMEDSKIVSGLGATFRPKQGESTVTVGKTEAGDPITLSKEDVDAMKKAVKEFMGFKPKATGKKKKEKEEGDDKAAAEMQKGKSELLKNRNKKKKDELALDGEVKESTRAKTIKEIYRNVDYADYYLRKEVKKVSKTDKVIAEAFKDRELKDAIKDALQNKTQKQINQLLEK